MNRNKILFVGGPQDGYRRDNPATSGPVIKTYINTFSRSHNDSPVDLSIPVQTWTYIIKRFVGENGKVYEAAFDDSIKDPMEALIKGYRGHRNPRNNQRTRIKKFFVGQPPYDFK